MQDFTTHKALTIVQYILKGLGGSSTLHETFKILYEADMFHLAKYGRTITRDWYVKMDRGPVPSGIYDLIKDLRHSRNTPEKIREISAYINVIHSRILTSNGEADLDYISDSEIEALDNAIAAIRTLTFGQRQKRSHGPAWQKANWQIGIADMAEEGGANKEMLKYIKEVEGYKNYEP